MERLTNGYQRLFEVRLLHHYWLDDGETIFDLIATSDVRERRLLNYDMRKFLSVAPTAATVGTIAGFGGIFKEMGLGFVVGVPVDAAIPADTSLDFVVTVTESAFFNYTALTLVPYTITDIFYQPEKRAYRYKENVFLLSNLTGGARTLSGRKVLFLSKDYPALSAADPIESLILSGPSLLQLTSDQPGATTRQLAADASTFPVFVNQADVPVIVPPPGMTGAPARGIRLDEDGLPDDILALIRLTAERPTDQDFSYIDQTGHPKAAHPVYQVRLKNRSTIWKYIRKATGAIDTQTSAPLPLTFFGNAGTRQKPSEGFVKPQITANKIIDLISEIYI
jgi:hypothetical protein